MKIFKVITFLALTGSMAHAQLTARDLGRTDLYGIVERQNEDRERMELRMELRLERQQLQFDREQANMRALQPMRTTCTRDQWGRLDCVTR